MKKQLSFLTKYFMKNVEKGFENRFENFIFEGGGWWVHVLRSPWQLVLSAIAVLALMPTSELATSLSFFISKELRAEPCHLLFVLRTVLDNIASSEGLPVRSQGHPTRI